MSGSLEFDNDIQEDDMKGSGTYLVVGADLNLDEVMANNLSEYRMRFSRLLLDLAKISQHGTREIYQFAPVQDFSRVWMDIDLYAKYKLTEKIAFVESMINRWNEVSA